MGRAGFALLAGVILLAAVMAESQTPALRPGSDTASAHGDSPPATMPAGTALNAELNSSLDSRKAKVGGKVEAHTTEEIVYAGKTIIPKGARLEGHITVSTARAKGDSESTLAIQFDRAIPKKDEAIALDVMIMAVAAPVDDFYRGSPTPSSSDPMAGIGGAAAAGSPMGAPRPQPPPAGIPASLPEAPGDSTTEPHNRAQLPASSRGVYGLKGLRLMMVSSKTSQTTVIVSSGKDVHLDGGTRLLLIAQAAAPAAPGK